MLWHEFRNISRGQHRRQTLSFLYTALMHVSKYTPLIRQFLFRRRGRRLSKPLDRDIPRFITKGPASVFTPGTRSTQVRTDDDYGKLCRKYPLASIFCCCCCWWRWWRVRRDQDLSICTCETLWTAAGGAHTVRNGVESPLTIDNTPRTTLGTHFIITSQSDKSIRVIRLELCRRSWYLFPHYHICCLKSLGLGNQLTEWSRPSNTIQTMVSYSWPSPIAPR